MIMPLDRRVKKQQICLECQRLQAENEALKQQIDRLNQTISKLSNDNQQKLESITSSSIKSKSDSTVTDAVSLSYFKQMIDSDTTVLSLRESPLEIITKESSLTQKLALFKGLLEVVRMYMPGDLRIKRLANQDMHQLVRTNGNLVYAQNPKLNARTAVIKAFLL